MYIKTKKKLHLIKKGYVKMKKMVNLKIVILLPFKTVAIKNIKNVTFIFLNVTFKNCTHFTF